MRSVYLSSHKHGFGLDYVTNCLLRLSLFFYKLYVCGRVCILVFKFLQGLEILDLTGPRVTSSCKLLDVGTKNQTGLFARGVSSLNLWSLSSAPGSLLLKDFLFLGWLFNPYQQMWKNTCQSRPRKKHKVEGCLNSTWGSYKL